MHNSRKKHTGKFAAKAFGVGCVSLVLVGCLGFGIAAAGSSSSNAFGFAAHSQDSSASNSGQGVFASVGDTTGSSTSSLASRTSHDISTGIALIEGEERAAAEAAAAAERAAIAKAQAAQLASANSLVSQGAYDNGDGSYTINGAVVSVYAVDWSIGQSAFVAEWTERINSYLAGSPLAGYGSVFAQAAWEYGVDPRWSPAISNTESSKGQSCFASHNAWGWGSSSWSSWEEAIWAHVAGLAQSYGSTITPYAASVYCPPSSTSWFVKTASQMNTI